MKRKIKLTILGYGTMGKAIASEIKKKDKSVQIFAVDKNDSMQSVKNSDFVILSVKPQDKEEVIKNFKKLLPVNAILISIMAGVSITTLKKLSSHTKIVRMMPNLGLSVGAGISAWKSSGLTKKEKAVVENFINKISENFEVKDEDAINKVTAISASGPAYFFLFADSMLSKAKKLGFDSEDSRKLVEKTFLAASLLQKNKKYADLIKIVASKGGTTEAALKIFKKENLNAVVGKAIEAAYKRSKQLSK